MDRRSAPLRRGDFDPTAFVTFGAPTTVTDAACRFHAISDDYCARLQRSREELMNIDWLTIVHHEDATNAAWQQEMLMATGEPYEVTCRVLRGDGLWLTGHFLAARIDVGRGRAPLVQSSARFDQPQLIASEASPAHAALADSAFAEYIQSLATELAKMAGSRHLKTLHHLLSMASMEAADEAQRHFEKSFGPLPRRMN